MRIRIRRRRPWRGRSSRRPSGLRKYPDPLGQDFRRRAGEMLGVAPDWILCGNGSDDILTIVTRALVGQGQLLRLPYPSYILYKTLAELQGARSEEVHFNADWSLPAAFAAGREDLRLVFLANPNSPSGTVIPPQKVLEIAEQLPCPLLVDEAYADFAETNCVNLVARCEKIMVSRTLSKSYALAGLRFGYLVAQPHLIEQFVKMKDSYNCDAPGHRRGHGRHRRRRLAGGQSGEDRRHARAAGGGNAEARVCDGRFPVQLHLERPFAPSQPDRFTSGSNASGSWSDTWTIRAGGMAYASASARTPRSTPAWRN